MTNPTPSAAPVTVAVTDDSPEGFHMKKITHQEAQTWRLSTIEYLLMDDDQLDAWHASRIGV